MPQYSTCSARLRVGGGGGWWRERVRWGWAVGQECRWAGAWGGWQRAAVAGLPQLQRRTAAAAADSAVCAAPCCGLLQRARRACGSSRSFMSQSAPSGTAPAGAWWRCRWVGGGRTGGRGGRGAGQGAGCREMGRQRAVGAPRAPVAALLLQLAKCFCCSSLHSQPLPHTHTYLPACPLCRTRLASCGGGWLWSTTKSTSSRERLLQGMAA